MRSTGVRPFFQEVSPWASWGKGTADSKRGAYRIWGRQRGSFRNKVLRHANVTFLTGVMEGRHAVLQSTNVREGEGESGEERTLFVAAGLAPLRSRKRTISMLPCIAARCRGVPPNCSRTSARGTVCLLVSKGPRRHNRRNETVSKAQTVFTGWATAGRDRCAHLVSLADAMCIEAKALYFFKVAVPTCSVYGRL